MKKLLPWAVAIIAVGAAAAIQFTSEGGVAGHGHPDPRAASQELSASVMPPTLASNFGRAVRAYQIAQQIPAVLDGIHCHCECRENIGHRSLLTCFQTRHGAACDICIGEAEMAASMTQQGQALEAIRQSVDATWGSRHL